MTHPRDLLAGKQIRKFEQKAISEFPPMKTAELVDRDFYVLGVVGELDAGDFGPSWVVEIVLSADTTAGYSWLVNKTSVLGRQLETEKEKRNAFPFECT